MIIVKYKFVFLGVAAALVIASAAAVAIFGLKQGIDFTGGASWHVTFERPVSAEDAAAAIKDANGMSAAVRSAADGATAFIRTGPVSEEDHQVLRAALETKFGTTTEQSFQSIGSSIGRNVRRNSITATVAVLAGISLYVAFAFRRASRRIASWKYGAATLLTLAHDIFIPLGLFAVLGAYAGVEIDGNIVVALLVVAGFSVHDTIVVFDRIRENSSDAAVGAPTGTSGHLALIISKSIKETLARSINTSFTLVLMLIALLIAGPASLFYFVLAILVGVIAGTYSSICVASPLILLWEKTLPADRQGERH
ncbi:MAG: protein translocase subunit SecF [Candidatus Liptonbacteria bacterium]|nr:protein translocase subunit SecF [Candidatus Liptonbacteria bacterium]